MGKHTEFRGSSLGLVTESLGEKYVSLKCWGGREGKIEHWSSTGFSFVVIWRCVNDRGRRGPAAGGGDTCRKSLTGRYLEVLAS